MALKAKNIDDLEDSENMRVHHVCAGGGKGEISLCPNDGAAGIRLRRA